MRHVALVAPHFVPSNLTSVHRARLLASHLPEFGWKPTIVTVHEKYYEEPLEPDLSATLPPGLEIRKASAFSVRPVRWIGDVGVRGFWGMWREIRRLHRERPIDFLHVTIPSNFAAPLGRLARERLGVPYGIDYIDPWVHEWPEARKRFSKAWWSLFLGSKLEPWSVARASLITGITAPYYQGMLDRNPGLSGRVVTAAMPYGWSPLDYRALEKLPRKLFLFEPGAEFNLVYAGAILPQSYPYLEAFLGAVRRLRDEDPAAAARLRVRFIGTGKSAVDARGHNVLPLAERFGVAEIVSEHPRRIGYLDVLNHLKASSAVLILGSTEAHYSPSKCFQAVLSKRPVLAVLHAESEAVPFLRESGAGRCVTFAEGESAGPDRILEALRQTLAGGYEESRVRWELLERFSAAQSSRALADAMDRALSGGKGP
ncbi:MAG TPA: glycosyltransferase [Candidatus Eisenbacteria bacterium]|nr:glycosyltransferase [Candidatus Eisenbacteria bacterium]